MTPAQTPLAPNQSPDVQSKLRKVANAVESDAGGWPTCIFLICILAVVILLWVKP